ncbi:FYVE zinc finger-domain-containing protein [Rhypophila decipiens]|uniref:RING-type E3 ubiquitin transferase n=1 Tax=Rhypophila decipiens TaxID=261697 RepID=A0AAN6XWV9_9PEZI|nr:FYVE zinc finger-domain-containing protein [Rhypophila decipiens]
MATHDRGGTSSQAPTISDSESGSSYVGSGQSSPRSSSCRWRTTRFHDQECSRYFDCPSHIVERALSHNGEEDDEDENHTQGYDGRGHTEQEEVEITGHGHDTSGNGTVSPVSDDSRSDAGQGPRTREAVSPSREASTANGTEESPDGEDEVEITGSRNISENPEAGRVFVPRRGASGSAENPIVLPDDSPPQSRSRRQPYTVTAPSSSVGQVAQQATPASSTLPATRYPPAVFPRPSEAEEEAQFHGFRNSGFTRLSEAILESQATRPPLARPPPRSPDIVLPRWQPDAEVTYCPICTTQFSVFVRKHHCRKCGRVVCNSCSPHRITIPYQYIVRPPGTPSFTQSRNSSYQGSRDQIIGGGERVRLCNPCVPDPNVAPPQQAQSGHSRSQSSLAEGAGPYTTQPTNQTSNSGIWGSFFGEAPANNAHARSRSVTMQHGGPSGSRGVQYNPVSTENQILSGTPPFTYRRLRPTDPTGRSSNSGAGPSLFATGSVLSRPLPPQPLAEEDECPVCHRELPSRSLRNAEALREAHITTCITSHSTYSGGVPPEAQASTGGPGPSLIRRTGMFPYAATEKDCVDSAECTICLEEFEVGVPMARLECLCRFHRDCITAWWERHPGRCPVHQHDGFGY